MRAGHLRSALAPKLDSALALGPTLGLLPVLTTLAFSSVASLFGAAGQGNYAAANGALEAWAQGQASSGLSTTAVQWGAWAAGTVPCTPDSACGIVKPRLPGSGTGQKLTAPAAAVEGPSLLSGRDPKLPWSGDRPGRAGMAADAATLARIKRTGMGALSPALGISVLAALLGGAQGAAPARPAVLAAMPVAWPTLLRGRQVPGFFQEFAPAAQPAQPQARPRSAPVRAVAWAALGQTLPAAWCSQPSGEPACGTGAALSAGSALFGITCGRGVDSGRLGTRPCQASLRAAHACAARSQHFDAAPACI